MKRGFSDEINVLSQFFYFLCEKIVEKCLIEEKCYYICQQQNNNT